MNFQPIEAEDKELICKYLKEFNSRSCDLAFASIYLWREIYHLKFDIIEDCLVFRSNEENRSYSFPIGKDPKKAIEVLKEYNEEKGRPLKLHSLTEREGNLLEELFPGEFDVEYDRDLSDYLYEVDALANLRGKKYHGKKNHINFFKKTYDWAYEKITDENVEDCIEMLNIWKQDNCDPDDAEKHTEICVSKHALLERDFLGLKGGLIRADGKVVAFALGEKISEDTFDVHVEKAFSDVRGAYPMINQQLLLNEAMDCIYVNREEDAGEEGLRQAKLSYHPAILLSKGMATQIV